MPHIEPPQPVTRQQVPPVRGRKPLTRILTAFSVALTLVGASGLVWTLTAPQEAEKAYGEVKVLTEQQLRDLTRSVPATQPSPAPVVTTPAPTPPPAPVIEPPAPTPNPLFTVRLGASGGDPEVDRCDGTFTEMLAYQKTTYEVPPVWAAHNNCGGDVVLPLKTGDVIELNRNGESTVVKVVDIREASKLTGKTSDLHGMKGSLVLQSCYYGVDTMRFVGVEAVS